MQTLLKIALVNLVAFASVAHAEDEPYVQNIEHAGSVFLADPAVSRLILDTAVDSQRTLLVDRIVTSASVADGARAYSSEVCLQLNWHGGDVIGTWGTVTGRVKSQVVGRGVVIEVLDVKFVRNDDEGRLGRCLQ